MAVIKLISSEDAIVYIDQEEFGIAKANQILRMNIAQGVYLLELKSLLTGKTHTEDLEIVDDASNFIKRIDFTSIISDINQLLLDGIIESVDSNGILKGANGYGVLGSNGDIIIPLIYKSIELHDGYYRAKKDAKYALLSVLGKVLIPNYSTILSETDEKIILVNENILYIFSKIQNSIIARYSIPEGVDYEIFPVKDSRGAYGYINRAGEIILEFIYEEAHAFDKDLNLAKAKRYGITKYINDKGYICPLNRKEDIEIFLKLKYNNSNNRFERYGVPVRTYKGYGNSHGLDWIGNIVAPDVNNLFISSLRYISICDKGLWSYAKATSDYWEKDQYLHPLTKYYDCVIQDARFGFPVFKQGDDAVVVNLIGATYRDEELEKLKKGHGLCPGWHENASESLKEEIREWHEIEKKIKSFKPKYVYGEIGAELFRYTCEELIPILSVKSYWRDDFSHWGTHDNVYAIKGYFFKDNNGKYGIIDENGEIVVSPQFSSVFGESTSQIRRNLDIRDNKYFIVGINNRFGLYNIDFEDVLSVEYDSIEHIRKDIFIVQKSGLYYFFRASDRWMSDYTIDFSDAMLSKDYEPKFMGIYDFVFKSNGKLGAVNKELQIVVPFKFDFISRSECWYAGCDGTTAYKVRIGTDKERGFDSWKCKNKYGIISPKGVEIVPVAFSRIDVIEDSYDNPREYKVYKTVLERNSKGICVCTHEGIYDEHGKEILPCKDWSIQRVTDDMNFIMSYIVRQGSQMGIFNASGVMDMEFQQANEITAVINKRSNPQIFGYIIKRYWNRNDYDIVDEHGNKIIGLECSAVYPEYNQMEELQFYTAYSEIDGNSVSGIINPTGAIVMPMVMMDIHYIWIPSDIWGEEQIKGFIGTRYDNGTTYAVTINGNELYCGTEKSIEELTQLILNDK